MVPENKPDNDVKAARQCHDVPVKRLISRLDHLRRRWSDQTWQIQGQDIMEQMEKEIDVTESEDV